MSSSNTMVKRIYSSFRGVDFRGEEISLVRSPDSLNMWKDYKEMDSIRTRPCLEEQLSFSDTVYGIFFYKGFKIVHSGESLYKVDDSKAKELLFSGLNRERSQAFVFDNVFYFKDGKYYLQYDGTANEDGSPNIKEVVGYIPTTSIARIPGPTGGGEEHEDINFLSKYRINTFLADGVETEYLLDVLKIDEDFLPIVTVNDKEVTDFSVDYAEGKITFTTPPDPPATDGRDNVSVKFAKTVELYQDVIQKCTLLQVFDNRVFFCGNPNHPNVLYHSSLNDPTYCSDTDYYNEGMDSSPVRGIVAGNNALWIFREPSDENTTVFYHTPTTDDEYGKIYPNSHSSVSAGCVGAAINFNDDIVFFSTRGLEGISGDITTEQILGHRSTLVDRYMTAEENYRKMILAEWEGYLFVFIDNKAYLADSRAMFSNENHVEYDWFYWEFDRSITCAKEKDGVLYLGTESGIYTLTDFHSDVKSHWATPKDKFKYPQMQKTTNKRGCVVEALGDFSVYAKTEKTEYESVGDYENVRDHVVPRIKRKKFKDLQLKFASSKRFSLESVTLECFIGGYIKR